MGYQCVTHAPLVGLLLAVTLAAPSCAQGYTHLMSARLQHITVDESPDMLGELPGGGALPLIDSSAGPVWKDHSLEERQAQLQRNIKNQKQRRLRRMEEDHTDALAAALEVDLSSICHDSLATNAGEAFPCTYDCDSLVEEYFPAPHSQ